ncbi:hypothetical protein FACS1894179_09800 [Bacteroidia bacterium]|nr:hypothetical protein FACS1894179_09800 [Bacteroidia bacterium]
MLDKFDKTKNPFKVPENYFEDFNRSIMESLPAKENKARIVPLWKKVLPWTAAAAIFCGVLFTTGVLEKSGKVDPNVTISSNLSSSLEDDYFLFLKDEVVKSQYKEMVYNY